MLCFGLKIIRSSNVIMDESELELKIREMKIPVARLIPDAGKSLVGFGLNKVYFVGTSFKSVLIIWL